MFFSDNVKTTVNEKLIPKTVDTILNSTPLALRLLGNQKTWSGTKMKFPIKYQKNNQGKSFSGLNKFNTSKRDTRIMMAFSPTGREIPVVLSGMEIDVNATDKQVVDLMKLELASSAQDMCDDIAGLILATEALATTRDATEDFLSACDACDDGTTATTYGGQTRSVYTGIKGNLDATTTTLTAAAMRALIDKCTHGNDKPTLIATTKAIWATFEALLTLTHEVSVNPKEGYPQVGRNGIAPNIAALRGQKGFDALWFQGIPLVKDEKLTAKYMLLINEAHLAFYGLKATLEGYKQVSFVAPEIEGVYSDVPVTTGFAWSGLLSPTDQYGKIGHLLLMGNLISDSPRHLGMFTKLAA